jgi:hypothetical protein
VNEFLVDFPFGVSRILCVRQAYSKIQAIADEMYLSKMKAQANAALYKAKRAAEANKLKFTPEYLRSVKYAVVADAEKTFFTESLHDAFAEK